MRRASEELFAWLFSFACLIYILRSIKQVLLPSGGFWRSPFVIFLAGALCAIIWVILAVVCSVRFLTERVRPKDGAHEESAGGQRGSYQPRRPFLLRRRRAPHGVPPMPQLVSTHPGAVRQGSFSGPVWLVPATLWTRSQLAAQWPPPTDGPAAIAHKFHATLVGSDTTTGAALLLVPERGAAGPATSRAKADSRAAGAQHNYMLMSLEGVSVDLLRDVLENRSPWMRRCPMQLSHPSRPLLLGETTVYMFAETGAAKEQWYAALQAAVAPQSLLAATQGLYADYCRYMASLQLVQAPPMPPPQPPPALLRPPQQPTPAASKKAPQQAQQQAAGKAKEKEKKPPPAPPPQQKRQAAPSKGQSDPAGAPRQRGGRNPFGFILSRFGRGQPRGSAGPAAASVAPSVAASSPAGTPRLGSQVDLQQMQAEAGLPSGQEQPAGQDQGSGGRTAAQEPGASEQLAGEEGTSGSERPAEQAQVPQGQGAGPAAASEATGQPQQDRTPEADAPAEPSALSPAQPGVAHPTPFRLDLPRGPPGGSDIFAASKPFSPVGQSVADSRRIKSDAAAVAAVLGSDAATGVAGADAGAETSRRAASAGPGHAAGRLSLAGAHGDACVGDVASGSGETHCVGGRGADAGVGDEAAAGGAGLDAGAPGPGLQTGVQGTGVSGAGPLEPGGGGDGGTSTSAAVSAVAVAVAAQGLAGGPTVDTRLIGGTADWGPPSFEAAPSFVRWAGAGPAPTAGAAAGKTGGPPAKSGSTADAAAAAAANVAAAAVSAAAQAAAREAASGPARGAPTVAVIATAATVTHIAAPGHDDSSSMAAHGQASFHAGPQLDKSNVPLTVGSASVDIATALPASPFAQADTPGSPVLTPGPVPPSPSSSPPAATPQPSAMGQQPPGQQPLSPDLQQCEGPDADSATAPDEAVVRREASDLDASADGAAAAATKATAGPLSQMVGLAQQSRHGGSMPNLFDFARRMEVEAEEQQLQRRLGAQAATEGGAGGDHGSVRALEDQPQHPLGASAATEGGADGRELAAQAGVPRRESTTAGVATVAGAAAGPLGPASSVGAPETGRRSLDQHLTTTSRQAVPSQGRLNAPQLTPLPPAPPPRPQPQRESCGGESGTVAAQGRVSAGGAAEGGMTRNLSKQDLKRLQREEQERLKQEQQRARAAAKAAEEARKAEERAARERARAEAQQRRQEDEARAREAKERARSQKQLASSKSLQNLAAASSRPGTSTPPPASRAPSVEGGAADGTGADTNPPVAPTPFTPSGVPREEAPAHSGLQPSSADADAAGGATEPGGATGSTPDPSIPLPAPSAPPPGALVEGLFGLNMVLVRIGFELLRRRGFERWLQRLIQNKLDRARPGFLERLTLQHFDLGYTAPQLKDIRAVAGPNNFGPGSATWPQLALQVVWVGNATATIATKIDFDQQAATDPAAAAAAAAEAVAAAINTATTTTAAATPAAAPAPPAPSSGGPSGTAAAAPAARADAASSQPVDSFTGGPGSGQKPAQPRHSDGGQGSASAVAGPPVGGTGVGVASGAASAARPSAADGSGRHEAPVTDPASAAAMPPGPDSAASRPGSEEKGLAGATGLGEAATQTPGRSGEAGSRDGTEAGGIEADRGKAPTGIDTKEGPAAAAGANAPEKGKPAEEDATRPPAESAGGAASAKARGSGSGAATDKARGGGGGGGGGKFWWNLIPFFSHLRRAGQALASNLASNLTGTPVEVHLQARRFEGTLLLWLAPPPSDRLWLSFAEPPKMDFTVTPVVGNRRFSGLLVGRLSAFVRGKVTAGLSRAMVYPSCVDVRLGRLLLSIDSPGDAVRPFMPPAPPTPRPSPPPSPPPQHRPGAAGTPPSAAPPGTPMTPAQTPGVSSQGFRASEPNLTALGRSGGRPPRVPTSGAGTPLPTPLASVPGGVSRASLAVPPAVHQQAPQTGSGVFGTGGGGGAGGSAPTPFSASVLAAAAAGLTGAGPSGSSLLESALQHVIRRTSSLLGSSPGTLSPLDGMSEAGDDPDGEGEGEHGEEEFEGPEGDHYGWADAGGLDGAGSSQAFWSGMGSHSNTEAGGGGDGGGVLWPYGSMPAGPGSVWEGATDGGASPPVHPQHMRHPRSSLASAASFASLQNPNMQPGGMGPVQDTQQQQQQQRRGGGGPFHWVRGAASLVARGVGGVGGAGVRGLGAVGSALGQAVLGPVVNAGERAMAHQQQQQQTDVVAK